MPDDDQQANIQHITIEDDGRLLAEADVRSEPDVIRAALRVEAGHLPARTRARLVDAVLDTLQAPAGTPLEMTLPAGDAEILLRMRERCTYIDTRAAGASCLLQTTTPQR
jgi:hypothetical protein